MIRRAVQAVDNYFGGDGVAWPVIIGSAILIGFAILDVTVPVFVVLALPFVMAADLLRFLAGRLR